MGMLVLVLLLLVQLMVVVVLLLLLLQREGLVERGCLLELIGGAPDGLACKGEVPEEVSKRREGGAKERARRWQRARES